MSYQLFHLRDPSSSNPLRLLSLLHEQKNEAFTTWGVFPGLFGLATNEAYWVVQSDAAVCPLGDEHGVERLNAVSLSPTVRPAQFSPLEKSGIYVFRWFEVQPERVAEVVALSNEAWTSFEGGFDTEVQGLFTVDPTFDRYGMVLCTWYENLTVWQESRAPDPAARDLFARRQSLLDSARPIATRLDIKPNGGSV